MRNGICQKCYKEFTIHYHLSFKKWQARKYCSRQCKLKLSQEILKIQYGKKASNSQSKLGGTGVDGGGGNLRKGLPLSRNEFKSYLANSNPNKYPTSVQKITKYLFNTAYNSYTGLLFGYDTDNNPKKELILRNLHRKLS